MTKKILGLFLATALISTTAGAQNKEFKKLASGLEYKFIVDKPGQKLAVPESQITMHIRTTANDSTLFDSYKMNDNQPVPAQVTKPSYAGDVMEGISMMSEGDSAIFRAPAELIFKNNQYPPFVKEGDKVQFQVKMISVKTKEEFEADQRAAMSKQLAAEDPEIKKYIKDKKLNVKQTASGLYYVITKEGDGAKAQAGQMVSMNYTGTLLDGTAFDSNVDPKFNHVSPFEFKLGVGQVIKGWDEGIALLSTGGKAVLIIPSPLAYGPRSMPGNPNNPKGIPANSPLVFEVEMLGAK
ncbi:MAG: FKBP-type peptidyl-prolyl cis-trans isomerase [Chitinophagaceae bacterium]|nr:FKBP-type peptidyl-prolyl cis-trans isomerase [Chitinophagaceae bacterium]